MDSIEERTETMASSSGEPEVQKKLEINTKADSSMHEPQKIEGFVDKILEATGEKPRAIKAQLVGIKTLQNPGLSDRFLQDFKQAADKSSFSGEIIPFVLDDSWDSEPAESIQQVAKENGVPYYRVRDPGGFANELLQRFEEGVKTDQSLSPARKRYTLWLARAALKDRLQAPLTETIDDLPKSADALNQIGGIAGTQNFGYLAAAYESGKRGFSPEEITITINEDDQRYLTLARTPEGKIIRQKHDFFAERAAWVKDPKTRAITGRYTCHTGNLSPWFEIP